VTTCRAPQSCTDAVAQGLAVAKVYALLSVDYPGASGSLVFHGEGNDAVGAFKFDGSTEVFTAFTFRTGCTRSWPFRTQLLVSRQASMAPV
jgi:hypothetical protein